MTLQSPSEWPAVQLGGALLLARVVGWDGDLVTQASLSALTYEVFDLENGQSVANDTLTISEVIFDEAQSGGNWPYDDGYNFKFMLPATCLPNGAHRYMVEVWADPVSGEDFRIPPEGFTLTPRRKR